MLVKFNDGYILTADFRAYKPKVSKKSEVDDLLRQFESLRYNYNREITTIQDKYEPMFDEVLSKLEEAIKHDRNHSQNDK